MYIYIYVDIIYIYIWHPYILTHVSGVCPTFAHFEFSSQEVIRQILCGIRDLHSSCIHRCSMGSLRKHAEFR
jgi:hypothetical protein